MEKETKVALENELRASLVGGHLPYPVALKVAKKLQVSPKTVGSGANYAKIRISNCQLGCFVVKKAVHGNMDSLPVIAGSRLGCFE